MASQTTTTNNLEQKWKTLFDLGHSLAFNLNMLTDDQESFDFIYKKTRDLMNTEYLFIVLGNKITRDHKLHILGKSNDSFHEELRLLLQNDKKKIEKLFAKESYFLKTQTEVATFFELDEVEKNKFPATWLTAPIRWQDRVAGTFIIYHPTQNDAFDENDHEFLQAISDRVAIYLYNRRLSQRQIIVSQIAKQLTSTVQLREKEVLELIYEQACQLMYCHNMLIILRNKQTGDLRFALVYENGERIDVEQEQKRFSQQPAMARIKHVIETNKPLLLNNENDAKNTPATWMAVPMRLGEKGQPAMGVFVVYSKTQSRAYDKADCDTLDAMSDQAAIALDNVYFNQKLELLAEHSFAKNINLTEEEALKLIFRKTGEFIGDTSQFFIALKDKGQVKFISPEGGQLVDCSEQYKNRVCWILVEGILADKKTVLLENKEAVKSKLGTHYEGKLPASWLGVPMRLGDSAIGVFVIYNENQEYAYDRTDEKVLDILSDRAAIILDNARLNQRQKALAEIGQELTKLIATTESNIVNIIYERAKRLMDVSNMYIILQDDITGGLRFALAYQDSKAIEADVAQNEPSYKLAQYKIRGEILKGKPILLKTKPEVREAFTTAKTIESELKNIPATWLGVPMRLRNETMGAFVVYHPTQEYVYNEEDGKLLDAMSDYVAIAIDNQHLLQRRDVLVQIQRSTTELRLEKDEEFVKSISEQGTITELQFGEKEAIALIHKQASKLIDTSNLSILLKNKKTGQPYAVLSYKDNKPVDLEKVDLEKEENWNLITDFVKEVFEKNCPVHHKITDLDEVDRWWLGVPMRLPNKEILGVFVMNRTTSPYEEDVANILDAMSDHAAITLDNAHKHSLIVEGFRKQNLHLENQNHKLNALIQVAQELTFNIELSEEQILGVIHTQANKVMDTQNMYAALYDEQKNMVRFPLYFESNLPKKIPPREMGYGKTEEIIRTKKHIFHPTLAESKEWYAQPGRKNYAGASLPSWIGVPMMYGDKVLGVIATYHPTQEHVYGEEDLTILEALARLAAITLENARLYTESQQQSKALEKANRQIAEDQEIITRSSIADAIVHRINNIVGIVPPWIEEAKEELEEEIIDKQEILFCLEQIEVNNIDLLREAEKWKQPRTKVEINITPILESLLSQFRTQYSVEIEKGQLEILLGNIDSNLCKVFALSYSLREAIRNVILNGIESILEKGSGTLSIHTANVVKSGNKKHAEIKITDTGQGILKENLDKIFIPFFTTKKNGTGFGLWHTKRVIEEMEGQIKADSEMGEKTIFTILLQESQEK